MAEDRTGDQPEPEEMSEADLQQEVEALRQRNAALEQQVTSRGGRVTSGLRSTAVVLLLVIATVLATLTPVAIWGRNLVLNTDRYTQTVAPLASDPGVQQAVVMVIDQQFAKNVDVSALAQQVLTGPAGKLLAGPLESAAEGLVNTIATRLVESDQFKTLWETVNRQAHTAIVAVLTGKGNSDKAISIANDQVTLNLGPIVDQVKAQLVAAGLSVAAKIPVIGATLKIADVHGIDKARRYVRLLDRLAKWLPLLALLFFAGAVMTARNRRRALIASGLLVSGGMLVVGLSLNVGRHYYITRLNDTSFTDHATGQVYDTLVRYLRDGIRLLFVIGLLFALVMWVTGPADPAQRFRVWSRVKYAGFIGWTQTSPAVATAAANRGIAAAVIVSVAALILLLWTNPGPGLIVGIVLIAAVLLVIVFANRPEPVAEDPDGIDGQPVVHA